MFTATPRLCKDESSTGVKSLFRLKERRQNNDFNQVPVLNTFTLYLCVD